MFWTSPHPHGPSFQITLKLPSMKILLCKLAYGPLESNIIDKLIASFHVIYLPIKKEARNEIPINNGCNLIYSCIQHNSRLLRSLPILLFPVSALPTSATKPFHGKRRLTVGI